MVLWNDTGTEIYCFRGILLHKPKVIWMVRPELKTAVLRVLAVLLAGCREEGNPIDAGPWGTMSLVDADAKFIGEEEDDRAGVPVTAAGDVNGDGYGDLLLGAYGQDSGGAYAGAAYLILGPVSGTVDLADSDAKFVGEEDEDLAGASISSAGDINEDGYDDIVVGAMGHETDDTFDGTAYLLLGPVTGTVDLANADAKYVGEEEDDRAGWSVSTAGDVDGDGYVDMLVGAEGHDAGGPFAGAAYLLLGGP